MRWLSILLFALLLSLGSFQDLGASLGDIDDETLIGSTSTSEPITTISYDPVTENESTASTLSETSDASVSTKTTVNSTAATTHSTNLSKTSPTGATATSIASSTTSKSTASGATIATTTTRITTTTAPEVYFEFDVDCNTTSDVCVYSLQGPQSFKNLENDLTGMKSEFLQASADTLNADSSFKSSQVLVDLANLEQLTFELKENATALNETVVSLVESLSNALENFTQTESIIKNSVFLDSCYSNKCLHPSPPPPTTTPYVRPTTVSVCSNDFCKSDMGDKYDGVCLPVNGKPVCQCPGNLNQASKCSNVNCPASLTGLPPGIASADGSPLWSPNYDPETSAGYASNSRCVYRIDAGEGKKLRVTSNKWQLDPTARLIVNNVAFTKSVTNVQGLLDLKINNKVVTSLQVSFSSGAVASNTYFFDWTVTAVAK